MKFDFVIGNPPYQNSTDTYNRQEAIYPYYYDAVESIAPRYMLISPARFLFNGGLTSKAWNKKMLSDEHLKIAYYNENSCEVFPNVEIKGGVAITYRDSNQTYGMIGEFIPDSTLMSISKKFSKDVNNNLPAIMFGGRSDLKFNENFLRAYPTSVEDRLAAIQKSIRMLRNSDPMRNSS